MSALSPGAIVAELDKHIVGQDAAKRAVAIALRNRWRRSQVPEQLRSEIAPKNILMIGPTGVGKTEIARRLARLVNAPFIKVEATKFTEVGYVGRDVESMIRDLMDVAMQQTREQALDKVRPQAQALAEERILDILLRQPAHNGAAAETPPRESSADSTRALLRKRLRDGQLAEREIEVNLPAPTIGVEFMTPPGLEELSAQLQKMLQNMPTGRPRPHTLKIAKALTLLAEEEAGKLLDEENIKAQALEKTEQRGIVFIDEIDKVVRHHEVRSADVSREGVQRDILPLVEGSTVSTRYGPVNTDHILFIASGAFHLVKPSDLIPELQGRLPIRVELSALCADDFVRILVEPDASLTRQYIALLAADGCELTFSEDGLARIAAIAWQLNDSTENIGARRLHTVLEYLLEEVSFSAPEGRIKSLVVDAPYVDQRLQPLLADQNLSRYIL